ncbi:MAG: hypothetical protein Q8L69_14475 [Gallionellaceae bacterium]|nr:hypothetical protein [Gallionellaceae bacterium]
MNGKQTAPKKVPQKKTAKKKPVEPPPPAPTEEPLGVVLNVVDAPRDYVSDRFVGFVNRVDHFFGDDRYFQESNDSVLQLDITRIYGYQSEHKFVFTGRAKIHLPSTEKRLHLVIESDPDKNTSAEAARTPVAQPGPKSAPKSYAAGVRYEKAREERWHFSSDLGVQFQGLHSSPFVRSRASYAIPLEEWRLKAAETLFWFHSIGAGETTQLDLERTLSQTLLFRASSNATWLHDTQNMEVRQDFSFYQTLDDRTALLYQASAIGASQPQRHMADYVFLVLYRYRLHRDWMYFELSPQLHFPRDQEYRASKQLNLRLEMLFDEVR